MQNVKPLLDSLTALHFARIKLSNYDRTDRQLRAQVGLMASELTASQQRETRLVLDLAGANDQLLQYRRKYRRSQVEVWLWRIGATYLVYKTVCPSCKP